MGFVANKHLGCYQDATTNSIHTLTPLSSWETKNIFLDAFNLLLPTPRKMMDSGQIDFYQHDTVCTNTCRSTKFDVLINSTRLPPGTPVQPSPSNLALDPLGGQVPPLTGRFQLAFSLLLFPQHMLERL